MIDATFSGRPTRYRMLETLRAFGLDRLAATGETTPPPAGSSAGRSS